MKQWNSYFSQFRSLNWLMIWLLLSSGALLLLPLEQLGEPFLAWQAQVTLLLWAGLLVALSYFVSQGLLIGWDLVMGRVCHRYQQARLETMITCLDFNEKAVLREFIFQRKSVINLPVTEPAVKNLLDAGVLTYAYGNPHLEDDIQIKALMIALPARPYITYRALGLSKGKMSDEQIEYIMNARPKFASKGAHR